MRIEPLQNLPVSRTGACAGRGVGRCGGFTLTEMLTTVAIMAAMAVIVAPHLRAPPMARLQYAGSHLSNAIAFARDTAIATQTLHAIVVEPPAAEHPEHFVFTVARVEGQSLLPVEHPITHAPYVFTLPAIPQGDRVWVSQGDLVFDSGCNVSNAVGFDSHGIPRCLDPVSVTADLSSVVLQLNDETTTVSLDPFTGRITQF